MEPQSDNPIPEYDPRSALKLLYIAVAAFFTLLAIVAILVSKKPNNRSVDQDQSTPSAQVVITSDGFEPATLTVNKGMRVTWTNADDKPHIVASNPHPEHNGLAGFDSKDIIGNEGGTFSFIFDTPGEYTYHDHLNPTINGTIIVVE